MNLLDLVQELVVTLIMLRLAAAKPGIIAAAGDTEQTAEPGEASDVTMIPDECKSYLRDSGSEKMAKAFFKIAFSARRRAFSCSNR